MNLTDTSVVQSLCRTYGIYPSRKSGQNFLVSQDVLKAILDEAHIQKSDTILEVGPGFGTLTLELASRAKKVFAVEQDPKLVGVLQKELDSTGADNVKIVSGDILRIPRTFLPSPYRIVSNLPYQITSFFLRQFLEQDPRPTDMTLMVQKEVAERITAEPGRLSLLGISVQLYADAEIAAIVPRKAFWPIPDVDSAIVSLRLRPDQDITKRLNGISKNDFFKIVRNGFLHRRQKLSNNLSSAFHIPKQDMQLVFKKCGMSDNVRAQELSIDQWIDLAEQIVKRKE